MTRRSEASDFWRRVRFGEHDECWPWTGCVDRNGYGTVTYQGRKWLAHRLAVMLSSGEEPAAACHSCDNPPCCNPVHLVGADLAWNCRDRAAKGRSRKPGVRLASRLTAELPFEETREEPIEIL